MIELAPRHKSGLVVPNPVLLAGGVVGCGESFPQPLRVAGLGGVVVGPLSLSPRRGSSPPRLGETTGGFVLETGLQNRGVRGSIKRFKKVWAALDMPVVAQVAEREPDSLKRLAGQLETTRSLAGLELLVPPDASAGEVMDLVAVAAMDVELPLWVKLPYATAPGLAEPAVRAGADALVVCQPPLGTTGATPMSGLAGDHVEERRLVTGSLHGPAMFPMMVQRLADVASQQLGVPLIACGGIHSWHDAAIAMDMGATAIQIDSAVWVEPGIARQIVRDWSASRAEPSD